MTYVPYPGKYESFESWDDRCKAAVREQDERNAQHESPTFTASQQARFDEAERRLPAGFEYAVIGGRGPVSMVELYRDGKGVGLVHLELGHLRAQCYTGNDAPLELLLLNRVAAALWHKTFIPYEFSYPLTEEVKAKFHAYEAAKSAELKRLRELAKSVAA